MLTGYFLGGFSRFFWRHVGVVMDAVASGWRRDGVAMEAGVRCVFAMRCRRRGAALMMHDHV